VKINKQNKNGKEVSIIYGDDNSINVNIFNNNWNGEGTGWASFERLHQFASTLGLDMDKFSECMSKSKWNELLIQVK